MQFGSRAAATVVRIAGPALVVVLGRGASRAVRRAFRPDEVVAVQDAPGSRIAQGLLTAVAMDEVDPAEVRRLLIAAQLQDRAVDAVLLDAAAAGLPRRGFRTVTELDTAAFTVERLPASFDHRDRTGPFDVIGDVHGCGEELLLLLARLGYEVRLDALGRPDGARHPEGRTAVFVGDLVDRGPDVPGVLRLVLGMLESGTALSVLGNHDDKLRRALLGNDVALGSGLDVSLAQLAGEPEAFREAVAHAIASFPAHLVLDGGALVVAHAGLAERYHGHESHRVRTLCLYGPTTGETDADGLPVRLPWADDYRGAATVVYGHTPTATREWRNGTFCVDGGCVFGGSLVALRYPERVVVEVPATSRHSVRARPFLSAG